MTLEEKPNVRSRIDSDVISPAPVIPVVAVEPAKRRRLSPEELVELQEQARVRRPRVVVTGMGTITPLGFTVQDFWRNLVSGKSGISRVTLFDASNYKCQIAGEIRDFDPNRYVDSKDARRMARSTLFAIAAAQDAIKDAGFSGDFGGDDRVGVLLGTALGGFVEGIRAHDVFLEKGPDRISPFLASAILPNMPAFHTAQRFRARGHNTTVTTACAAGTHAVGEAAEVIRRGQADIMITGGTDAIISDIVFAAFGVMRALSTRNHEPTRASRPFDKDRDGFVVGEGGAVLILEKLESAVARGAHIYAEVAGYAANSDAFHFAAPDPQATGAIRVMQQAIENAGISPDQVGYINAHGTSTPLNDAGETLAIKQVFGDHAYHVPISSTKSMIGHSMGAAGAFEAVACVMTLCNQLIHPTVNYETPDPTCDLDYVPNQARSARIDYALSNSFGLGGQNGCLVFRRYPDGG